eukprot:TRINITY_DN1224_c0_g1_i1.p1 TRINITY_DN1224_c0_g1~~TRINITY_DN1224_c0_g1_i1.p1  ORF type:complete len:106 (+),score=7.10 TRINITY_DN1224_c0_g1_i1:137-454(+)
MRPAVCEFLFVGVQFYDHMFEWGREVGKGIEDLLAVRRRNGIMADSRCDILAADEDLYMAAVGEGSIFVKIGPRFDIGSLAPPSDAFRIACFGNDFCVWERSCEP